MFVFYNVFHLSYWISSASNYFFGSILSYALNRGFTFQNGKSIQQTLPKFVINIVVCYIAAYGIAKPLVKLVLAHLGSVLQDNISMLVGMMIFVAFNYVGQRNFVFNER